MSMLAFFVCPCPMETNRYPGAIPHWTRTDASGATNEYTENKMPESWSESYALGEHGHTYKEQLIDGLAKEITLKTGNTRVLWNGIVTKALVKMLRIGKIKRVRECVTDIRTIIFAMKEKLWQNRNELNFDEAVEHERLEEVQMRRQIATHIRLNDMAQKDNTSVEAVMDMAPDERQSWMRTTRDRGTRQCAIDQFFTHEHTPLTRLDADEHRGLLAKQPDNPSSAPTSTQQKIRFPRAPPQSSVQIGGLNRQQYAELVKTHQSTLRTAQKEPKRIAAALKRQRKAAERKRKRGRSRTRRKGSVGPIFGGPTEHTLDLEIPQRKPRSHEWGTRELETHNDRCERFSLGGQVVECFTCNSVWHRKCADSLPNKGPTLQYWQCDICVEEEIAEYGTRRDQLRPQQPALTTIDAETATEKAIQPTDESDESQDEESDLAIEDSETDEE